jgi:hypothetical protein
MESMRSETTPPRALFFDLDGTLLDSRKSVSPLTLAALKRLNAGGIGTYVATARPLHIDRQLRLAAMGAEFLLQGVFMNGAVTRIDDRCEYAFIDSGGVDEAIALARDVDGLNVASGGSAAFNPRKSSPSPRKEATFPARSLKSFFSLWATGLSRERT